MALPTLESVGTKHHLVTLEAPSETVTAGKPSIPWPVQATVWAAWQGLSGADRTGLAAETANRFTIWYRADVNPRWRVGLVGTTRKFQIVSVVDPDGRRIELTIVAQELIA